MFYKLKAWFGRAAMFALISIPQMILAGTLFVPLAYIGFPWWANALIFLFTLIFDKLGAVVYIVVWVWSFVIFLRSPLFPQHFDLTLQRLQRLHAELLVHLLDGLVFQR